jgi:hypothetical protein
MSTQLNYETETIAVLVGGAILLVFTALLVQRFSDPSNYWTYTSAVYISWLLGFSGIILLPLDVAFAKTFPVDKNPLLEPWRFVFWTTFWLAWVVDPLLQSYHDNGSYSIKSKICGALKQNLYFYILLIGLVIGAFVIISIIETEIDVDTFLEVLIDLGTVYGMFFILVLLGYGLIAIPKSLWKGGDAEKILENIHFNAQEVENAFQDAKFELEAIIRAVKNAEERTNKLIKENFELKTFIASVVAKCPFHLVEDMPESTNRKNEHKLQIIDMITFADLHAKLLRALRLYKSTNDRWQQTLDKVDELEALIAGNRPVNAEKGDCFAKLYWWWRLNVGTQMLKFFAIICGVLSLFIIWGEITILFVNSGTPVLSIYGLIINVTSGGFGTVFATFVPLLYMSSCVFYSMFEVKFLKHFTLTKRASDASALLFNAYYLCRLQFSLGYNFLLVLDYTTVQENKEHYDSSSNAGTIDDNLPKDSANSVHTAFQHVIGNMSSIWWFNRYSPILLIVLALATAFNLHAVILNLIGVDVFLEPQAGNTEHRDRIKDGQRLLRRERDKRERLVGSDATAAAVGISMHNMGSPYKRNGKKSSVHDKYTEV